MDCVKNDVISVIDNMQNEIISSLQKLITYPTTMGNEIRCQEYLGELFEDMGCTVDMWMPTNSDMDINPDFLSLREDYEGSPNVVGVLKGKGEGNSIMLNGHIDVVPEGENDWLESPWKAPLKDGRIYGRGACDMKGGLIANIYAVKAIKEAGFELNGDIILASVTGEETGGSGTLSLISKGYKADAAIVPEPTDGIVCPVNLGAIWFRIKVKGVAGHAAKSANGINAINVAADIIKGIETFEQERSKRITHEMYDYNPKAFCVNVGTIKGGVFPTSIPDEVILEGRLGYSPNENLSDVKSEFEKAIEDVGKSINGLKKIMPEVEWYGFAITSGGAGKEHKIVNTVSKNYEQITGEKPVIRGTPWGTDAGALSKFGETPAIVYGPGPGGLAHKANEYVEVNQLLEVTKVIACSIIDWCGVANK